MTSANVILILESVPDLCSGASLSSVTLHQVEFRHRMSIHRLVLKMWASTIRFSLLNIELGNSQWKSRKEVETCIERFTSKHRPKL